MNSHVAALLLIFGLGHPAREPLDTAKAVPVTSRVPCDGITAPAEDISAHATFPPNGTAREFRLSRFHQESCALDVKGKCMHKEKAEWQDAGLLASEQPSVSGTLFVSSCYAWGSSQAPQYVLSGWYQDTASGSKPVWKQAPLKQVSSQPEVFEFSDPSGGAARLELRRK